jgi:hypothetical protein
MLDKYVLPYIQAKLPNPRIDVSAIYYALKYRNAPPGTVHDLRFASMLSDLGLPALHQHDAFNDALTTAMMYVQLRDMQERGVGDQPLEERPAAHSCLRLGLVDFGTSPGPSPRIASVLN